MKLIKLLLSGSLVLALSSFVSRAIGVYRDHLLATQIGAGETLDAYFAAFRIPDLFYYLLVFSTVSVAFLPIYNEKLKNKENQENLNKFTSQVLNLLLVSIGSLAILTAIFAPYLVSFYASAFSESAKELTIDLMRLMLLSPIIFSISSVLISLQNVYHKFLSQALAPIFYNIGILAGIFFYSEFGAKSLAYGVVFGAVLHLLIQIPGTAKLGFSYKASFSFGKEIKKLLALAFPRMLSVSLYQITITVDTLIAASLVAGSVSILNLALNVASLPLGMVITSIAITSFTYLSKFSGEKKKFNEQVRKDLEKTFFWAFPVIFGLYAVSSPLIGFLFVGGEFGFSEAELTKEVLFYLLFSLFVGGLVPLLSRAFFAVGETRLPFVFSLIASALNIFASYYFAQVFGLVGIAIGTVIGTGASGLLLLIFGIKKFGNFFPFLSFFYAIFSGFLMFVVLNFLGEKVLDFSYFAQLLILTFTGALVYFGLNFLKIKRLLKV